MESLQNQAWNGKTGTIVGFDTFENRWKVRVDDGSQTIIGVHTSHLTPFTWGEMEKDRHDSEFGVA